MEREGADNPRKDLRNRSDFRFAYWFFTRLFAPLSGAGDERLTPLGGGARIRVIAQARCSRAREYQASAGYYGLVRVSVGRPDTRIRGAVDAGAVGGAVTRHRRPCVRTP